MRMGRLVFQERESCSVYPLPAGVGDVVEVRYISDIYPKGLLLFEAPTQPSYRRMFRINGYPHNLAETRELLQKAYETFHTPCWMVAEADAARQLVVHPPVVEGYLALDFVGQETDADTAEGGAAA